MCRRVLGEVPQSKTIVDCSTAPISLAKELEARFQDFADAPVARTRQAAIDGTLSTMVGASELLNNMVLSVTLAKGFADSFALRNHGMKALLPEAHPERAFPVSHMLKDVMYALELARSAGLDLQGAGTARRLLEETVALRLGDAYHTAILEAVRKHL